MGKAEVEKIKNSSKTKKEKELTKVVIRRLPPSFTEEKLKEELGDLPAHDFFYFVGSDMSFGPVAFARAYINFRGTEDIIKFRDQYDGFTFKDSRGNVYPAVVEYAPFQGVPKKRLRKDPKCGTIEKDADYEAFLETLNKEVVPLPSAEAHLEEIEARKEAGHSKVMTPLLEYIKMRKSSRGAGGKSIRGTPEKKKRDEPVKALKKSSSQSSISSNKESNSRPSSAASSKDKEEKIKEQKRAESRDNKKKQATPVKDVKKDRKENEKERPQSSRSGGRSDDRRSNRERYNSSSSDDNRRARNERPQKGSHNFEGNPENVKGKERERDRAKERDRRQARDDKRGPRDREREHRPPREDRDKPRGDSKKIKSEEKPSVKLNKETRAGEEEKMETKGGAGKREGLERLKSKEHSRLADEEEKERRNIRVNTDPLVTVDDRRESGERSSSGKPRIRNKDRPEKAIYQPRSRSAQSSSSKAEVNFTEKENGKREGESRKESKRRDRERERDYDRRDRDHDRRDRDSEKERRDREKDRGRRDRERDQDRRRDRDRDNDRERDRNRDRDRERDRSRDRDRERERNSDRNKERDKGRDRDHEREHARETCRDRGQEKESKKQNNETEARTVTLEQSPSHAAPDSNKKKEERSLSEDGGKVDKRMELQTSEGQTAVN